MSIFLPSSKRHVIGHRGARGHAPENTLLAAALAHAVGSDFWELDVNYTRDGQLVIIHDDTLERTTDVLTRFPERPSYRVCDFTLEELRTLDAGSWYAATDPFKLLASGEMTLEETRAFVGLRIPTLDEVLLFTKEQNWAVNVEIKDHAHLIGHDTVTRAVIDRIRALDMVERVLLSSFQHQYLREAHVLCPELATGALVEIDRPTDPVALCRELHVIAYHPEDVILAPGDLAMLRDAGFAINIWTVNGMDAALRFFSEGATGIITDFPKALIHHLDA